ncbi:hypothetical protein NMU03_00815 [Allocoprobacillus halotolerans]|uniref:Uncharacterized protein n=1 Tax=Allocoprobacillus halotolerans TaxID=2944914 RepID=A0ABY5I638_9FIRM|nr:hypothetical protein [Allocoprobacillus halotolerans]UTY39407.1 hypothetical protein NMU03_00815 [Allocoprobacillus halotolerans]
MLSDLVQYFTQTDDDYDFDAMEDNDLTCFLRFIYDFTVDDEIKNQIEVAVHNGPEGFVDIYEYGFHEDNYLNDMHLGDALDMSYDNVLVTMLLSCVMHTMHFDVKCEDFDFAIALDDGSHIDVEHYRIDNYKPYNSNRKIDKYLNDFIIDCLKDFEDPNHSGYIDGYDAETERVNVSYVRLKNKSYARKLRKAYAKNLRVRLMFNELKYYMVNGEFVFAENYNIEAVAYNGFFDMDTVYDGMKALIEIFGIKDTNQESLSFKRALANMNDYLYYSREDDYNSYLFSKILECHAAPGGEVIL